MVKQQVQLLHYISNKFNVLDNKMKLIREEIESVEFLVENRNGKKSMYIEGVFLQGNIKNRNGRMYPMETLRKEVSRYNDCLLYTSPSPRDGLLSRMPSSA